MPMMDETLSLTARIITLMSDGAEWTVKELRLPLDHTSIQVRRVMNRLAHQGILSVTSRLIGTRENVYILNGVRPDGVQVRVDEPLRYRRPDEGRSDAVSLLSAAVFAMTRTNRNVADDSGER